MKKELLFIIILIIILYVKDFIVLDRIIIESLFITMILDFIIKKLGGKR